MQLIRSLKEHRDSGNYPFHMPGHKRRLANDKLLEEVCGIDITEIEGFDNLHDANGIIKEAQERAAICFGADEAHFLVNGSTGGILAAITALAGEGDSVIFAKNCHRSVYNAIMLCGAKPYAIAPKKETYFDIYGGIRAQDVSAALAETGKNGGRTVVVITSPTYEGITSDVASIADVCHKNGAVLIVDAAHGAHFGFSDRFPKSAQSSGADVVITSVHKTLPAMTQTALLFIGAGCPSKDAVRKMLTVFMTSSPSYVLMSSIDSMTALLTEQGKELFDAYEKRLDTFYGRTESFSALSILNRDKLTEPGSVDLDMGKIVISDMTGTLSGRQLSDALKDKGLDIEMVSSSYVVLMTSIADSDEGFARLAVTLEDIDAGICLKQKDKKKRGFINRLWDKTAGKLIAEKIRNYQGISEDQDPVITEYENNIKSAMLWEDAEYIPVELAEGRIAKDMVTVYPPGIPVCVPGQKICGKDVDLLLDAMKKDLDIKGLNDKEIAVLWEKSST